MRLLYAIQFCIPESLAENNNAKIYSEVVEWIKGWYKHWKNIDLEIRCSANDFSPYPLHNIYTKQKTTKNCYHYTDIVWRYPDNSDDTLLWESKCEWAAIDDLIEFSFSLRLASREFLLSPPTFKLFRPKIIKEMAKKFQCKSGDFKLNTDSIVIDKDNVRGLIDLMVSDKRKLPIILLSTDPYTEKPIINNFMLQDKLIGLAHVVVLHDKWASFALTDAVGKQYSCFNGAIKLYWPNFSLNCDPKKHPILLPEKINKISFDYDDISQFFFKMACSDINI